MLLDGLTIRENILVPRIVQGEVTQDAEQLADKLTKLFGIGHYPEQISRRDSPAERSSVQPWHAA